VHRLGLLDTAPERRFDRLTEMAAMMFTVPMASISLVDRDRQWFKSRIGLDMPEISREIAFCAHAILAGRPGPFVVEDTLLDDRFFDNPLVRSTPNIRFYAGQPLHDSNGLPVGTLSVIDRRPRLLDPVQQRTLRSIADLVEQELNRQNQDELMAALARSQERRAIILDTIDEGVVVQDASGRIIKWNPAAARLLDLDPPQPSQPDETGRYESHPYDPPLHDSPHETPPNGGGTAPHVPPPAGPSWGATHIDGSPWTIDSHPATIALRTRQPVRGAIMRVQHQSGRHHWLRVNAQPIIDENGECHEVLATFTDVTAEVNETHRRELLEEELRRIEDTAPISVDMTEQQRMQTELSRISHLLDLTNQIVGIVDADSNVLYASPSNERRLGYPEHYRHPEGLIGLIHEEDRSVARAEISKLAENGAGTTRFTVRVVAGDESVLHFEWEAVNLLADPETRGIVVTARDISEQVTLTEQLAHLALHDALTDLPNRQLLETAIDVGLNRRSRESVTIGVLFIDIDRFRDINNEFGHAAGDQLLVSIAARISDAIREGDIAARVGNDEFVIVLDAVADGVQAQAVARRIRDQLAPNHVDGDGPTCTVSIGVAVGEPGDTVFTLLNRADSAMRTAKMAGGAAIEYGSITS